MVFLFLITNKNHMVGRRRSRCQQKKRRALGVVIEAEPKPQHNLREICRYEKDLRRKRTASRPFRLIAPSMVESEWVDCSAEPEALEAAAVIDRPRRWWPWW